MLRGSFTLIELIVVIAIIAILAAVIAPSAFRAIEKGKVSAAIADFRAVKTAVYSLYSDTGNWVTDGRTARYIYLYQSNDLITNFSSWDGWDGPYLEKPKTQHPWAGRYAMCGNCNWIVLPGVGTWNHMILEFEDWCYPGGPNGGCPIPLTSGQKIDETMDDSSLTTGEFWSYGGRANDYHWVLVKDIY